MTILEWAFACLFVCLSCVTIISVALMISRQIVPALRKPPLIKKYPLRCNLAPFEGEPDAGWTLCDDGATRCRRVKASELGVSGPLDELTQALDEELHSGAVSEAWGGYGDEMVSLRPGAKEAFDAWCDEWIEIRAYINESHIEEVSK